MTTMESLIGLVNRIQSACTVLGDHGGDSTLPTLWEALPSVAVVGGQVVLHILYFLISLSILMHAYLLCICLFLCLCFARFYGLSSCLIVIVEFWKVFGVGEYCGARFSSQRIRLEFN